MRSARLKACKCVKKPGYKTHRKEGQTHTAADVVGTDYGVYNARQHKLPELACCIPYFGSQEPEATPHRPQMPTSDGAEAATKALNRFDAWSPGRILPALICGVHIHDFVWEVQIVLAVAVPADLEVVTPNLQLVGP